MSIKGIFSELLIGKDELNVIGLLGQSTKVFYLSILKLELCYASKSKNGYVNFILRDSKKVPFKFKYESNDLITKAVECICNENSSIEIIEYTIDGFRKISGINFSSNDPLFYKAMQIIAGKEKISIGLLQRTFHLPFNHAAQIMDKLQDAGIVSFDDKNSTWKVMVSKQDLETLSNHSIKCTDSESLFSRNYDGMSGNEFENFCAQLLINNNFYNVTLTPNSKDHGVDILAEKDKITYAIQCKCYTEKVGNFAVQEAYTGKNIYNRDIAVVLTNSFFTPQAIKEADILKVKLWDRDQLQKLIKSA